jgi:AcrR family transcriptional regulator
MFVNRKSPASIPKRAPKAEPERRVPAQARSKERVERILEAAARVFADAGYEAATMEAIAELAGTSIGSIYQFFPNKRAVFDAIAARYMDKARAFFDVFVTGPLVEMPWPEVLDASIDAFAAFNEQDAGFRAVWVGMHLTEEVVTQGEALNREMATRLEALLGAKLPRLPPAMRPIVATMSVEVFSAMLVISARRGPEERQAMLAETKAMLRRYLAPWESVPPAPAVRSRRGAKR